MGYKEIRHELKETDSTLADHSMNQSRLKMYIEGERSLDNTNSKHAKAQARHKKEAEYMKTFPRM